MLKILNSEEAINFKVPPRIAMDENNIFIGREINPFDNDGPWPLLSFTFDQNFPHIVTIHLSSISPEALNYKPFNPLEEKGGYITLEFYEIPELIEIIRKVQQHLPEMIEDSSETFLPVTTQERLEEFHLKFFLNRHTDRELYLQINTSPPINDDQNSVLIFLDTGLIEDPQNLTIQIMNIPQSSLEDPDFAPFDYAIAKIVLDCKGLESLIHIINKYQHYSKPTRIL